MGLSVSAGSRQEAWCVEEMIPVGMHWGVTTVNQDTPACFPEVAITANEDKYIKSSCKIPLTQVWPGPQQPAGCTGHFLQHSLFWIEVLKQPECSVHKGASFTESFTAVTPSAFQLPVFRCWVGCREGWGMYKLYVEL